MIASPPACTTSGISLMSVPRPAILVAMVTDPVLPAWATMSASFACNLAFRTLWSILRILSIRANSSDISTEVVPTRTGLLGNTPNPFNPMTVIKFAMPEGGGDVRLEVFDARGRLVATLVDGLVDGGPQSVTWYGRDDHGQEMPSGVYFYRLDGAGIREALKMLLLR